ncbi:hypothetical protein [Nitratireductor luteus]|uniref:hypothetical protein n=1 Tax=Nitratireductor luteus TaxID=2976980 RepID=UPI00223ECE8B|nr:hypothetical protein [Nitratireductor luteus]
MFARLIALLATGEATLIKRRLKSGLVAYSILALTALLALVFLLLAAYLAATARWGAINAALWFGIGFLVLSLAVFIAYKIVARAQRRAQQRKRVSDTGMLVGATAVAMLPAILGKRSGAIGILLTLAGVAGYAAYRENERRRDAGGAARRTSIRKGGADHE